MHIVHISFVVSSSTPSASPSDTTRVRLHFSPLHSLAHHLPFDVEPDLCLMPRSFFERAQAGISSLINDASVRARAAENTSRALERLGGQVNDRLARALSLAHARRTNAIVESDELCDLQVGSTCYEDSPGFMRTQLWESLLSRAEREGSIGVACASSRAKANESEDGCGEVTEDGLDDMCAILTDGEYYEASREAFARERERERERAESGTSDSKTRGWNENVGSAIERDLSRTFPNHTFYVSSTSRGAEGREKLARVLQAYAAHDVKVGYCQGMAFVAGLLVIYLPNESRAFAALVTLMEQGDFRSMYLHGMEGLKSRLRQLSACLRHKNPTLAKHLEAHDVIPVLYASSWFMSCFASDFSVRFSGRVMDCLLARRSSAFVMRLAVAILNEASGDLLMLNDFEAIVVYLRSEPRAWARERLSAVIERAMDMYDLEEADILRLDNAALAAEAAATRSVSPSPLKRKKTRKSKTPTPGLLIDFGDAPTSSPAETASENGDEGEDEIQEEDGASDESQRAAKDDQDSIMDMLMALDMGDDWSVIERVTTTTNQR